MHQSVLTFIDECLEVIRPTDGRLVVEIGSRNVNGSARDVFKKWQVEYIGIDMVEGEGVDIVHDCTTLPLPAIDGKPELFWDFVDVVVCTEVLEHVEKWDYMVAAIKRMLMLPGSWLILTTRGPGFPRHDFPHDYWRFTLMDINRAFWDLDIVRLEPDPQVSGVFLLARRPMVKLNEIHPQKAPAA